MSARSDKVIGVLKGRGWIQGQLKDMEGRVCLQGALRTVESGDIYDIFDSGFGKLVQDVIAEQFPDRSALGAIATFNDHLNTTLADVIAVVEKAGVRHDEASS